MRRSVGNWSWTRDLLHRAAATSVGINAVQEPRWKVGFQHLGSLPDDIAVAVKAAVPMVQRFQSQAQAKVDDCALLEQETPDPLST
uniref:Uncharacterized protein n=1 Tax=Phytophthora fragariae TaxID=53985 RepID=A0A6A3DKA2_9STRA|nr:hypothetical protein PF009_g27967 [Phytophthora fragariae]